MLAFSVVPSARLPVPSSVPPCPGSIAMTRGMFGGAGQGGAEPRHDAELEVEAAQEEGARLLDHGVAQEHAKTLQVDLAAVVHQARDGLGSVLDENGLGLTRSIFSPMAAMPSSSLT